MGVGYNGVLNMVMMVNNAPFLRQGLVDLEVNCCDHRSGFPQLKILCKLDYVDLFALAWIWPG